MALSDEEKAEIAAAIAIYKQDHTRQEFTKLTARLDEMEDKRAANAVPPTPEPTPEVEPPGTPPAPPVVDDKEKEKPPAKPGKWWGNRLDTKE